MHADAPRLPVVEAYLSTCVRQSHPSGSAQQTRTFV